MERVVKQLTNLKESGLVNIKKKKRFIRTIRLLFSGKPIEHNLYIEIARPIHSNILADIRMRSSSYSSSSRKRYLYNANLTKAPYKTLEEIQRRKLFINLGFYWKISLNDLSMIHTNKKHQIHMGLIGDTVLVSQQTLIDLELVTKEDARLFDLRDYINKVMTL
tara:strand:- start:1399 stop:1890 length:492 start_codon:yes stop_codon:yes gene_type:complete